MLNDLSKNLISVVQDLSLARTLDDVMAIVRREARALTGADGATFVLKDGDCCYYADEDAVAPLWKGRRFPMSLCISGWVMNNAQHVVIENVFNDPRIPGEAYRPTFVKSMAMVPIRRASPIGAIGNYWADHRTPTPAEVELLQALADAVSVTLENITLYSDLQKRVTELEKASRAKDEFIMMLSHELRTPLNVILGWSELLIDDLDDLPGVIPKVERIQKSAQSLLRIVNDLLDLSLIKQDDVRLHKVEADIAELLAASCAEWRPAASAKGISMALTTQALPRIAVDKARVAQIFSILLSNSVKFSHKGGKISIALTREPGFARISFHDEGCGIDANFLPYLFDRFTQADSSYKREFGGVGLGLAIAKYLVDAHRGQLTVDSPGLNQGATFDLRLPLSVATQSSSEPHTETLHAPA